MPPNVTLNGNNVVVSQTVDLATYVKNQQLRLAQINTQITNLTNESSTIISALASLVPAPTE